MKSFFLERVVSVEDAIHALRAVLPGQETPWLLRAADGDAIAYFNVHEEGDIEIAGPFVVADLSGRHWDKMDRVLATLEALRARVGGTITTDD